MSGASVSLWDRDESLVKKTANTLASKGNVEYLVMDVTNLDSVKRQPIRQKILLVVLSFLFVTQALQVHQGKFGNIHLRSGKE